MDNTPQSVTSTFPPSTWSDTRRTPSYVITSISVVNKASTSRKRTGTSCVELGWVCKNRCELCGVGMGVGGDGQSRNACATILAAGWLKTGDLFPRTSISKCTLCILSILHQTDTDRYHSFHHAAFSLHSPPGLRGGSGRRC